MKHIIYFLPLAALLLFYSNDGTAQEVKSPQQVFLTDSTSGWLISGNTDVPWNRPYDMHYILDMRKYVVVQDDGLKLTLTRKQAIHSLQIPKQAYKDFYNNIRQTNKTLQKQKRIVARKHLKPAK